MNPRIVVRFTATGVAGIETIASDEEEEKAADAIRERIQPCLDVADALLKKSTQIREGF